MPGLQLQRTGLSPALPQASSLCPALPCPPLPNPSLASIPNLSSHREIDPPTSTRFLMRNSTQPPSRQTPTLQRLRVSRAPITAEPRWMCMVHLGLGYATSTSTSPASFPSLPWSRRPSLFSSFGSASLAAIVTAFTSQTPRHARLSHSSLYPLVVLLCATKPLRPQTKVTNINPTAAEKHSNTTDKLAAFQTLTHSSYGTRCCEPK